MVETNLTTIKKELDGEIEEAKRILTGLAAVAFLMFQKAQGLSDVTEHGWNLFFKDSPWIQEGEAALAVEGCWPQFLEEGLAELIFWAAGQAYDHIFHADDLIRMIGYAEPEKPEKEAAPEGGSHE